MQVTLRDYQSQASYCFVRAVTARSNPLVVIATGGGKSLVLADAVVQLDRPTLVLSHRRELLEQDSRALRRLAPAMSQSFYSAGLKEKRGGARVVFGSVQTVVRSLPALGSRSLLLIDEAHLCPRDAEAMYARVFSHFHLAQRGGFTATPQRLDSGSLVEGSDAWFDNIAYEIGPEELIKRGWLVPLSGVLTEQQANLAGVSTRAGEFAQDEMEQAVMQTLSLGQTIAEVVALAHRRRHWLIFAAGVEHAEQVLVGLKAHGIDAGLVTGKTADGERDETVERFREGDLRALVNVGVFTTGFDAPQTDCIVSLRPTKSPVLWEQVLGRGMRLADAKKDCLLLDFVGNLERLGGVGCVQQVEDHRVAAPTVPGQKRPKRPAPPRDDPTYTTASLADPMRTRGAFECQVESVRYFVAPSRRFKGKNMVIVTYELIDDLGRALTARSFVTVEYPGGARYHAVRWFQRRGVTDTRQIPMDSRTAMALAETLPTPSEVVAYWDPRLRAYLISDERFSAVVSAI